MAAMPRLVLVSIDGLAHFYWTDPAARMPVLRGLAERGASAGGMATVFVSTTLRTYASWILLIVEFSSVWISVPLPSPLASPSTACTLLGAWKG